MRIVVVKIEVLPDADTVAQQAAAFVAAAARDGVHTRGKFVMAVSGGRTPWQMLRALAKEDVPWASLEIFQVDERIAPAGDPVRNLTHLRASLLERVPLRSEQIHAMPVELPELDEAAAQYADVLSAIDGSPPVLDLIHLGLGADGHTASLIPGDPVLGVVDRDVAISGLYQGHRRMTLTYPIIDRARQVLWLVTGGDKSVPLRQLLDADATIPAGRVNQSHSTVLADQAAAVLL
jgi:6-phosphogluconolactonase